MIKFKDFLLNEDDEEPLKPTGHIEHLDDMILNYGADGVRKLLEFLNNIKKALTHEDKRRMSFSLKIDGAPSIFAGIDPEDGRFFVAKKSILNNIPKVYKTDEDIDADIVTPELNRKMKLALQYLPELQIKNIVQGDFLYDREDLKQEVIDGVHYITFQPNTIVYAVSKDTKAHAPKKIIKSEIGIVWHTMYEGSSLNDIQPMFNKQIMEKLKRSRNVWCIDAIIRDINGRIRFTQQEQEAYSREFFGIYSIAKNINVKVFDQMPNGLKESIKKYVNSRIKDRQFPVTAKENVTTLKSFLNDTENSKTIDFITKNEKEFVAFFDIYFATQRAKNIIMNKLENYTRLKTYLRIKTDDNLVKTRHEGYVVYDRVADIIVKLVDRLEFSYANFSPDVEKGWDRENS